MELLNDEAATGRISAEDITALTKRATEATFYVDGLAPEQLEANLRVVRIAAEIALEASTKTISCSLLPSWIALSRAT